MTPHEYLTKKGVTLRVHGTQAQACCPFCGDKEWKFNINLETGLWQCFHKNNCGKSGTFWTLQKEFGDEPEGMKAKLAAAAAKSYERPKPPKTDKASVEIMKWFDGRGISAETMTRFRIKQVGDEIAFPYIKGGVLVNVKYRRLPKSFRQEKNAEPSLFGHDLIDKEWPTVDELYITEGELDAMTLVQYGWPAVSVPNGASNMDWIDAEWDWLRRFKSIRLVFDNDKAGQDAVDKVKARLMMEWDLYSVELPFKDANDCLKQGLTDSEIADCMIRAQPLRPDGLTSLEQQHARWSREDEDGGITGLPIGIRALDDLLRGWRPGELTLWGGRDSSGKTTILNQLMLDVLNRRQRVCMVSPEMTPRKIVACMLSQGVTTIDQFVEHFGRSLYFTDPHVRDGQTILDLMNYAARRYDVRHFVIDSLGMVVLKGEDIWNQQKEFTGQLVDFTTMNASHVHLVNHARKARRDTDILQKEDLEGSGWIKNMAANVILVRRIRPADRDLTTGLDGVDAVLAVAKNREHGREGLIKLTYSQSTRIFTVMEGVQDADEHREDA